MKHSLWKRVFLISFILCAVVISASFVFDAQARPIYPSEELKPANSEGQSTEPAKAYDPAEFQQVWGISPDMLIECDPYGDVLAGVSLANTKTYHGLQGTACRQQVALENQQLVAGNLSLSGSGGAGGCSQGGSSGCKTSYTGVSGDGNFVKIAPVFTETRYVYLQCGKKVGVFGPPTCSCGSGNYHYTYSCQKPKTVYITIPCFR